MTFLDVVTSSAGRIDGGSGSGSGGGGGGIGDRVRESICHLSIGCGIFGRLSLIDNEVPLADVLESTRTAQQMKGRQ